MVHIQRDNQYLDDENCLENDYEDEDEVRYDTDSDDDSIIPDDEVPHVVLITKVKFFFLENATIIFS